MPLGKGRVRFLGALLPDPTEAFYHPYGLQNYAVTYTGYTLLQNMLKHTNPSRTEPPAAASCAAAQSVHGARAAAARGAGPRGARSGQRQAREARRGAGASCA